VTSYDIALLQIRYNFTTNKTNKKAMCVSSLFKMATKPKSERNSLMILHAQALHFETQPSSGNVCGDVELKTHMCGVEWMGLRNTHVIGEWLEG
jgi:hypothetical protein